VQFPGNYSGRSYLFVCIQQGEIPVIGQIVKGGRIFQMPWFSGKTDIAGKFRQLSVEFRKRSNLPRKYQLYRLGEQSKLIQAGKIKEGSFFRVLVMKAVAENEAAAFKNRGNKMPFLYAKVNQGFPAFQR